MLEELLAQIRAETSAGSGLGGLKLTKIAETEKSFLQKYFDAIKQTGSEAEAKDISRKRRRSKFRLGGSIVGGLLALATGGASVPLWQIAAGAGGGSLLASKYAQSTQPGGWRLKGATGLAPTGMFFGAGRERASGEAKDLQRYITEANKSFDEAQYVNALTDAWSAYKLASLPKSGDWLAELLKGRVKGEIMDDDLIPIPDIFEPDNPEKIWYGKRSYIS